MKNTPYEKEGACPACNSRNIIYSGSEVHDDSIAYEMDCQDCKTESLEWYDLVFSGFTLK